MPQISAARWQGMISEVPILRWLDRISNRKAEIYAYTPSPLAWRGKKKERKKEREKKKKKKDRGVKRNQPSASQRRSGAEALGMPYE